MKTTIFLKLALIGNKPSLSDLVACIMNPNQTIGPGLKGITL